MSLEQLFRRFWWVLLIALVFVWKNFQRKAKIRARRRRSLAKARRVKASGKRSGGVTGRARKKKPVARKAKKSGKLSKKEFLNRMRLGRLRAARARKAAGK